MTNTPENEKVFIPKMFDFEGFVGILSDQQQKELYYTIRNMLAESAGALLSIPAAKRDNQEACNINGMLGLLNSMIDVVSNNVKQRRGEK